jgi:dihydrofolate reductase
MSKLIVTEFVTLDGVMEAPGGEPRHPHNGWVFEYMGPEQTEYKFAEIREAEAHLIGRVTYEAFAETWPLREGEFADRMNAMPKYVVTSTLSAPLAWNNSHLIRGDVAKEIRELKARGADPILVAGSCTLVRFLLENDLVDELRLMVFPLIIGGGKRAFPESRGKKTFVPIQSRTFATSVAVHSYAAK